MLRRPVAVGRRRGLGLIGTTAVVGAAYHAGSQGAAQREHEQDQEIRLSELEDQQVVAAPAAAAPAPVAVSAAPAPAPASGRDRFAQLEELGNLHSSGVLTDAEFEREKARILG